MISFKSFSMLFESFKDAERKWTMAGNDPEQVAKAIEMFKSFRARKLTNQDIGRFIKRPFSDFQNFLRDLMDMDAERTQKRTDENNAKKIFENENLLVVVPFTHAASRKYGSNTQWCLTDTSDYYWKQYTEEMGLTPYYVIFKEECEDYDYLEYNDMYKIAVMVDSDSGIDSVYNAADHNIKNQTFRVPGAKDENGDPIYFYLDELMEHYGWDMNGDIYSYIEEEYEPKEVDFDVLADWLDSDEFEKEFAELNAHYEEVNMDPDDRVTVNDLSDFFSNMLKDPDTNPWLQNTDPEKFCDGEFNRHFSDFMKRTFKYPEAVALNSLAENFRDYIDEVRQNESGDKIRYSLPQAA